MQSKFEQYLKKYSITEAEDSKVISELRKIQAKLHPDANGDKFSDDDSEREFNEITSLIDWIRTRKKDLVHSSDEKLLTIIEELISSKAELVLVSKEEMKERSELNIQKIREKVNLSLNTDISNKYRPKFIGYSLLGALGVLFTSVSGSFDKLIDMLPEHTNNASKAEVVFFIATIGITLAILGAASAFYSYILEAREKEKRQTLLTETGFVNFFNSDEFKEIMVQYWDEYNGFSYLISQSQIATLIGQENRLNDHLSNEIAELYIKKLINKNMAKIDSRPNLSTNLELDKDFFESVYYRNR